MGTSKKGKKTAPIDRVDLNWKSNSKGSKISNIGGNQRGYRAASIYTTKQLIAAATDRAIAALAYIYTSCCCSSSNSRGG